jgi:long-chain acyl-CoA synthetase
LLASGAAIELLARFHPVEVARAIERSGATVMFGSMTMYQKMLDVLTREPRDLTTLRVAVNGAEPCKEYAVRAFEERAGCRLLQAYALSEARPLLALRPDETEAPRQSCGRLVPGAEIRLIGEDGEEVAVGEPGEAEVRCPGMMTAYNREPDLTHEKITADGWFKSGDILIADPDGYHFVVGRRSDLIIRSGVNIAPAEVESVLMTHDRINDAAVVGVPDPISGEAVVAFVVLGCAADIDRREIETYLRGQLAAYKVPQDIFVLDDLPVNASGKRDRQALKTMAEERARVAAD